jgi:general L-amino acid transport system permease protein
LVGLPLVVWFAFGAPWTVDWPALRASTSAAGLTVTPEYFALLLGLVLYTAGFIAEIVRAGIQAVPHGQWEAAQAAGAAAGRGAEADRAAAGAARDHPADDEPVPQHHQNSSLAVAIGYQDIVSIANTVLNQTARRSRASPSSCWST